MDCRNLRAEMVRNGIRGNQVANVLGLNINTAYSRLQGRTDFKVGELVKIRDTFFPELSLDYLAGFDERWR